MTQNDEKELWRGRYLRAVAKGPWEYIDRHRGRFAAVILAFTDQDELVLVEQFRTPIDATILELPAGLIGDETHNGDELALEAAKRELWEETGYKASTWRHLGRLASSPGMASEVAHFFLATGLSKVAKGGGDDSENITVHLIPRGSIGAWLQKQEKDGKIIDMKIAAGLGLLTSLNT